MTHDARKYAPAAARNRDVIRDVLGPRLTARGHVLEIASGSGEHITHWAAAYPNLTFQPSDPDADSRASIDAWRKHLGLTNVAPAIPIDAAVSFAPVDRADVIVCINMVHISPWEATVGLIHNAADVLSKGGTLNLYGPYRRNGAHTAPSNAAFDENLRLRNTAWGIRDLEAVAELAAARGFAAPEVIGMPANNFFVVLKRA